MYCIKCGVLLGDAEKKCPLCGTRVYHPDLDLPEGEGLYPKKKQEEEKVNPIGVLFILTGLFLIPMLITLLIDLRVGGTLSWSGYVVGGLMVAYVSFILPFWFKKPNPVIFLPCSLASVGFLLFYINYATGGHWFFSFALPLIGAITVILTAIVTLCRYVRGGYLYIFGGAILLSGALTLPMEYLINLTFGFEKFAFWSLYPMISCFILGMLLIVIAICPPLRRSLHKKFFV